MRFAAFCVPVCRLLQAKRPSFATWITVFRKALSVRALCVRRFLDVKKPSKRMVGTALSYSLDGLNGFIRSFGV